MKRVFTIALLTIAAIGFTSLSVAESCDIQLPDDTCCNWVFDQHNSYGGWSGRYACTATDGYSYLGWGPANNPPPEIFE